MPGITGASSAHFTVGHPTAHVRAATAFNALFVERGVDAAAVAVDVAPADLASFIPASSVALGGGRTCSGSGSRSRTSRPSSIWWTNSMRRQHGRRP